MVVGPTSWRLRGAALVAAMAVSTTAFHAPMQGTPRGVGTASKAFDSRQGASRVVNTAFKPSSSALGATALGPRGSKNTPQYQEDEASAGTIEQMQHRVSETSDKIQEKAAEARAAVKNRLDNIKDRMASTTSSVRSDYVQPAVRLVQNPVSIQYGIVMAIRLSYFMAQNGIISTTVDRRLAMNVPAIVRAVLGAIANGREEDLLETLRIPDERLTSSAAYAWWRANLRGIITLLRKEAEDIEQGVYKFPLDMAPLRAEAISQANPAALIASFGIYWRQQRALKKQSLSEASSSSTKDSSFIAPGRYPEYYLEGEQYLTAGKSGVMDYESESLMWGMADAMRRRALAKIDQILMDKDPAETELLDVGSGTGRFLSFVKDNFKSLKVTALDLSLFNLMKSRSSLKACSGVTFLEANSEAMPLPTESQDIVTCTFVLSEMPVEAQVSTINEMARTLKPGGRIIIIDGTQPEFDGNVCTLDGLPQFIPSANYDAYQCTDLEYLLIKAGLFVQDKEVSWVSKMLVAQKPPLVAPGVTEDSMGVGY